MSDTDLYRIAGQMAAAACAVFLIGMIRALILYVIRGWFPKRKELLTENAFHTMGRIVNVLEERLRKFLRRHPKGR
jgi:hypothetical protein